MSYEIVIGEEEFPLASVAGWKLFKKWAKQAVGQELLQFTHHGVSQKAKLLEADLRTAIQTIPIVSEEVQEIAHELLENLMSRDNEDCTIYVSGGTGPDDGELDEGPCPDINY